MSALQTHGRILAVDDDPIVLHTLSLALKQQRLDVTAVSGGHAAIHEVQMSHFDLVITDLNMPGLSGEATIKEIKKIAPEVPVIVVTGYASPSVVDECTSLGIFDLLHKPFDLAELYRTVSEALGGHSS